MTDDLDPDDLIALNRLTTVARVLAGTAHEVNNALQIIAGSAEMLGHQADLADATRRAVQRIQAQTTRAAETVNGVMQFARGESAPAADVSVRTILAKALALRAYQVRRAGLKIDFDDATAPAAQVHGRSAQLLQAIVNLIMNAEQAMTGRAGGMIRIELTESVGRVTLTMTDAGPGLAAEVAGRVFTPFVTNHPVPDTPGLGLAAARLIAQQHGGDVTLDCTGSGCRATLWLPAAA